MKSDLTLTCCNVTPLHSFTLSDSQQIFIFPLSAVGSPLHEVPHSGGCGRSQPNHRGHTLVNLKARPRTAKVTLDDEGNRALESSKGKPSRPRPPREGPIPTWAHSSAQGGDNEGGLRKSDLASGHGEWLVSLLGGIIPKLLLFYVSVQYSKLIIFTSNFSSWVNVIAKVSSSSLPLQCNTLYESRLHSLA